MGCPVVDRDEETMVERVLLAVDWNATLFRRLVARMETNEDIALFSKVCISRK